MLNQLPICMRAEFRFWHLFAAVLSLDCFVCSSNESFQACDIIRTKETCQPQTQCAKLSFGLVEAHRYRKGCLSVIYCRNPERYCQSIVDASDCETSCCSKDLCNSGPALTSRKVNYFVLLCAIAVMVMLHWTRSVSKIHEVIASISLEVLYFLFK